MVQIRRARTREKVLALQRAIDEAHAARGKEIRFVGRVRWNGRVLWGPPGAEGEAAEDCELESPF